MTDITWISNTSIFYSSFFPFQSKDDRTSSTSGRQAPEAEDRDGQRGHAAHEDIDERCPEDGVGRNLAADDAAGTKEQLRRSGDQPSAAAEVHAGQKPRQETLKPNFRAI